MRSGDALSNSVDILVTGSGFIKRPLTFLRVAITGKHIIR